MLATIINALYSLWSLLPARILSVLGIGLLVSTAATTMVDSLMTTVQGQISLIGVKFLQVMSLGGVIDGLSLILTAYALKAAYIAIPKFGRVKAP